MSSELNRLEGDIPFTLLGQGEFGELNFVNLAKKIILAKLTELLSWELLFLYLFIQGAYSYIANSRLSILYLFVVICLFKQYTLNTCPSSATVLGFLEYKIHVLLAPMELRVWSTRQTLNS